MPYEDVDIPQMRAEMLRKSQYDDGASQLGQDPDLMHVGLFGKAPKRPSVPMISGARSAPAVEVPVPVQPQAGALSSVETNPYLPLLNDWRAWEQKTLDITNGLYETDPKLAQTMRGYGTALTHSLMQLPHAKTPEMYSNQVNRLYRNGTSYADMLRRLGKHDDADALSNAILLKRTELLKAQP